MLALLTLGCSPYGTESAGLEDGYGWVIVGIIDRKNIVDSLRFRDMHSKEFFTVSKFRNVWPSRVKAGKYYLSSVHTSDPKIKPRSYPKPESGMGSFSVEAGSVNYLGFWHFRCSSCNLGKELELIRGYSSSDVIRAAGIRPCIRELPLRAVEETGAVYVYDWADILSKSSESP